MFTGLFACTSLLIGCGGGDTGTAGISEEVSSTAGKEMIMYPLDKCVVTGADLGETMVEFMHGNHQVIVANEAAKATFEANPTQYIAAIDAAIAKMQGQ